MDGNSLIRYQGVPCRVPKLPIRLTNHLAYSHVNSIRSPDRNFVRVDLHPPAVMPPLLGPRLTKRGGLTERKKTLTFPYQNGRAPAPITAGVYLSSRFVREMNLSQEKERVVSSRPRRAASQHL